MSPKAFLFLLLLVVNQHFYLFSAPFKIIPLTNYEIVVTKEGNDYLTFHKMGWRGNWKWMDFTGVLQERKESTSLTGTGKIPSTSKEIDYLLNLYPINKRQFVLEAEVSANADMELTYQIIALLANKEMFGKGKAIVSYQLGGEKEFSYPWIDEVFGKEPIEKITFVDNEGLKTKLELDPADEVNALKVLRIKIARGNLTPKTFIKKKFTVTLPQEFVYYPGPDSAPEDPAVRDWYVLKNQADHDTLSVIGMQEWLEKPAGKHGRVTRKGDKLFYNGKEFKVWGINLTYGHTFPKKNLADLRAAFYAKYGINAVRFHKFADGIKWRGMQSENSFLEFDQEKLDRFDYFFSKLKERGIYVKFSPTFTLKIPETDKQHLPYIEEFKKAFGLEMGRVKTAHGSIFLSWELQEMQIEQFQRLLNHKNPYTGLTYAEDPAVLIVEIFNEDDAFFFGFMNQLKKVPTLRRRAGYHFTKWLKAKYGSERALLKAWGARSLKGFAYEGFHEESFSERSILPLGNPWYFDPDQMEGSQKYMKKRLLDTMEYLYELQNSYYLKLEEGIRSTGYEGEIISSNWIAGRGTAHYYNLHTDQQFGIVDRHNYFGGGKRRINNQSMLTLPGSGILSTGTRQVANRPFMVSEWIHNYPNEWAVEGPAIIGAYGMGLQGWDVSFMFQNADTGRMDVRFRGEWQVNKPTVIGLFPAVARQVYRGDVTESQLIIPRYVHLESLSLGELDFKDESVVVGDIKYFTSDKVPTQALAIGRVVVQFVKEKRVTPLFDWKKYMEEGMLISSTKQLSWKPGQAPLKGYFTIDTEGTKAVVGFAEGVTSQLGGVTIESKSRFGAVYVTAIEQDKTIITDDHLLITAIARVRQTGMKIEDELYIIKYGNPPFVMEPVKAKITIDRVVEKEPIVYLLDHDGRLTGKTLPIDNGTIEIDTGRDKTPYYEVVY